MRIVPVFLVSHLKVQMLRVFQEILCSFQKSCRAVHPPARPHGREEQDSGSHRPLPPPPHHHRCAPRGPRLHHRPALRHQAGAKVATPDIRHQTIFKGFWINDVQFQPSSNLLGWTAVSKIFQEEDDLMTVLQLCLYRNNIHDMKLWRIGIGIYFGPKYQRIDL